MAKPFYQRPDFVALDREWRQKLRDSGFEDHESPTGVFLNHPVDRAKLVPLEAAHLDLPCGLDGRPLDVVSADVEPDPEVEPEEPGDLLADAALWEGLPEKARRAWGLVALTAWTPTRAAAHLGVHHKTVLRWFRTVKTRLEARGQA